MPACFHLVRKSAPAAGPVAFVKIDEELCSHLGKRCDPKHWCRGWYDVIGFALACGKTFSSIRDGIQSDLASSAEDWDRNYHRDLLAIVNWLDTNFISSAWYSR